MICPVCDSRGFTGTASVLIVPPTLPRGQTPLGRAVVDVTIIYTCYTCDIQMGGRSSVEVICRLAVSRSTYPRRMYDEVRTSYGDGWNVRAKGLRLTPQEATNPSTVKGWADAQAHSDTRKGKAPPKGWGHAKSKEYLKTETACNHLKMISLSELRI